MRNLIRILTATVLLLLALGPHAALAADDPSGAQPKLTFGIGPASRGLAKNQVVDGRPYFNFVVAPGTTVQDRVALLNLAPEPVELEVYATDAGNGEDGAFGLLPGADKPRDAGKWLVVKAPRSRKITVPGRTATQYGVVYLPVELRVPLDASPGDHVGGIVASLQAESTNSQGAKITLDQRIAVRAYISVQGEKRPELSIQNLKASYDASSNPFGRGTTTVTYDVANTGNVRMGAAQDLHIQGMFGVGYDHEPAAVEDLLPGSKRKFTEKVDGVWPLGPMKAKVTLHLTPIDETLTGGVRDVTASARFGAWNWLLLLVILALLALFGAGGWFGRRRRYRRWAGFGSGAHAAEKVNPVAKALVRGSIISLAVVGLAVAPRPANAAEVPEWSATPAPQSGTDLTPINVLTSGGCPLPGTNILGMGWGKGFPKEGAMVMGNTEAGVYQDQPIEAGLYATLRQVMFEQPEPVPFQGDYRIEIRCVSPGVDIISGKYVFTLRFTDAHNWHFVKPAKETPGPNVTTSDQPKAEGDPSAVAEPTPTPGAAQDPAQSPEAAEGSTDAAAPDEQLSAAEERAAELSGTKESASEESENGQPWPLYVGGLAALFALAAYFGVRRTKA